MVAIDATSGDPARIMFEVETKSELRTALWRFVGLAVFAVAVGLEPDGGSHRVHLLLLAAYAATSVFAVAAVAVGAYRTWMNWVYVFVDACLVVYLAAEHMFVPGVAVADALATPSLAVAFVFMTHASLRMRAGPVAVYAAVVGGGTATAAAVATVTNFGGGTAGSVFDPGAAVRLLSFAAVAGLQVVLVADVGRLLIATVTSASGRANLSRFFAPATAERIAAEGVGLGLRREEAAVLFVDIRGFVALAERTDLDDLGAMLCEYRRRVCETVAEWDGTVDKFIGDGAMVVFGFPSPSPSDARRAFECACELVDRLEAWSANRHRPGEAPLTFGAGVHFGEVIGGVVAGGRHAEYTVLGDAVNLAARLQTMCKPLSARIVISREVARGLPAAILRDDWRTRHGLAIPGRSGTADVVYLPRRIAT